MKSIYAVMVQVLVVGSDYALFIVFARQLDPEAFVAFSTAVGLHILAWVIADGGVSYVAPRELATVANRRGGAMAGAFLTLRTGLYVVATVGGFLLWNLLAEDALSGIWVAAYAAYALPSLLIPYWLTCWSMDVVGLLATVAVRVIILGAAVLAPVPAMLGFSGLGFLGFVFWLMMWLNRRETIVGWAGFRVLRIAVQKLSEVFLAKTVACVMYGLAPLIIGVSRGAFMASDYVTGERIYRVYMALFQPVVQIVYLSQFQEGPLKQNKGILGTSVHLTNVLLGVAVLLAVQAGALSIMGERFEAVVGVRVYLLAACLAVASGAMLYFRVFPSGDFGIFRRATVFQTTAFAVMLSLVLVRPDVPVAWILGIAEAALFVALVGELVVRRFLRLRENSEA